MSHEQMIGPGDFDQKVLAAKGVVLVDFSADWCGPCKMMRGIVAELAVDFEKRVQVYDVEVDDNMELASRFGVTSVPTFIIFRDGKVQKTLIGYLPKERLAETLEEALKS